MASKQRLPDSNGRVLNISSSSSPQRLPPLTSPPGFPIPPNFLSLQPQNFPQTSFMPKKRRIEDEVHTDSEEAAEVKVDAEEDLARLLEQISKQQLIEIIRSVSSENKKIREEIHERDSKASKHVNQMAASDSASSSGPIDGSQWQMVVKKNSSRERFLQRKIFVGNVTPHSEITRVTLHSFFSQYGEIQEGPYGFDRYTGKPKGFALFVYKTVEGATRALEEPVKNFHGHPLYCERSNGGGTGNKLTYGGSNSPTRKLPLKNDEWNGVGSTSSSPRAGAGCSAQNEVMGRRVLLEQGDIDGMYRRGKKPIQGHQLDNSYQIRTSGQGQAEQTALARPGVCVACVGCFLEKFILFILCLVGAWFMFSTVFDHLFAN